MDFPY